MPEPSVGSLVDEEYLRLVLFSPGLPTAAPAAVRDVGGCVSSAMAARRLSKRPITN